MTIEAQRNRVLIDVRAAIGFRDDVRSFEPGSGLLKAQTANSCVADKDPGYRCW